MIIASSVAIFKNHHSEVSVSYTPFLPKDIGNILCSTVGGIAESSKKKSVATQFLRFLLLPIVQQYIATALGEYPIIKGIITNRKFNDQTYTNRESFELIKTAQNPPK
ncbi:hypothetical protein [Candidatus Liberibacter asiaticus]|uniref:hypothetical protein n=1 Tax=Liberibacter asiaticus TaxID=34021 RepID=UPI0012F4B961|nr:hypothetical protein [Candidatus Liberibacter asiaticus]KAE9510816.1 hypothetical protein FXW31_04680 [Candidatus Liberibacter asiaticus]